MSEEVQTLHDDVDPARACALQATLGEALTIRAGDALPPFYHQIYFWDPQAPGTLGRDGHPKVGGVIPDMGLPRRMWAGGQLRFHAPFRAGIAAKRVSFQQKTAHKTGRSGPLGFVTMRHEIWQDGVCVITEFQDLVYREEAGDRPGPMPPVARTDEASAERAAFNSTVLFRYSALTFNGHRIHYDEEYARKTEGYGGLVVHGPLLAHLLMRQAVRHQGAIQAFEFKATSPLIHTELADLCWGADGTSWVRGPNGRQCMIAQVR